MPYIARGFIIDLCTLLKKERKKNLMRWKKVMFCNSTFASLHPWSSSIGLQMNYSARRRQAAGGCSWKMLQESRLPRLPDHQISNELLWKEKQSTNKSHLKNKQNKLSNSVLFFLCSTLAFDRRLLLSVYGCGRQLSSAAEGCICIPAPLDFKFWAVINNVFVKC